jgi:site-specific recombinase XerD
MLTELFPKAYDEHRSLPLLGGILDAFDDWLIRRGYRFFTRQCYILRCTAIEEYFRRRGPRSLALLTPEKLQQCQLFFRNRPGGISNTVGCLQRFLSSEQRIPERVPPAAKPFDAILAAYRQYLIDVRGLAHTTVEHHGSTIEEFLEYLFSGRDAFQLSALSPEHVEGFIRSVAKRFNRHSLQHVIAHVRGLLRFLRMHGQGPLRQDFPIDTPRVYRREQLPRSLPWETVRAFLDGIDRSGTAGVRDYAMFLLIAAYGLRSCDIAGLQLSDIDWRAGELRVRQRKTGQPLLLPLIAPVAAALAAYLRKGRPRCEYREVFLTVVAPLAPLKRQAVGYAFRNRVRASRLDIPFEGVHCLRHSHAAHLLRCGISVKTIGDLLGHASTESTCVYLRVNVDDLREVALPLPTGLNREARP